MQWCPVPHSQGPGFVSFTLFVLKSKAPDDRKSAVAFRATGFVLHLSSSQALKGFFTFLRAELYR